MDSFQVKEIESKSLLSITKLPDADYVVNPYVGCRFGCVYCYASFMGRFVDKKNIDWGNYVFAKVNASKLLKNELLKLKNKGKGKTILFSSVTDPYQGLESKYQLTRKCLEILNKYEFEGTVAILTKSDLVTRDIDVIKKLSNPEIGITITSTDDTISRYFEKYAPSVSQRVLAIKKLRDAGINTYVFIGPLLPHFVTQEEQLEQLFSIVAETGNKDVYVEHLNLKPYIQNRLVKEIGNSIEKDVLVKFYESKNKSYRQKLDQLIEKLVRKYDFHLRLSNTIYHSEL